MPEKIAKMAGVTFARFIKAALFSAVFWGTYLLMVQ